VIENARPGIRAGVWIEVPLPESKSEQNWSETCFGCGYIWRLRRSWPWKGPSGSL